MEAATGRRASEVIGQNCFEVFPFLRGCRHLMEHAMDGREVRIEDKIYADIVTRIAAPYNVTIKPTGEGPTRGIVAIFEVWPSAGQRYKPVSGGMV